MNLISAVKTCLRNYATFKGRAPRSEFWWFILFFFLVSVVLATIETAVFGIGEVSHVDGGYEWQSNGGPLTVLFSLAMVLPMLAVTVRRLHDVGKSGWFILIGLIPLIGGLVLLFFYVQPSQQGPNQFGASPNGGPPPLP
ncbi:uncharacterized membrane protein YhaH [Rhodobacter sp. JA431]|uniref:DUF805 domain-containing protein n=1 Tax=Rhodobacter sp. JA431 TaxID=570013 RepID=UPI000BD577AD|nr:DUF805 domain-containing protein [Rhodobacter sp. JA431]SOC17455.1 uncharacterized membrane protein YhaH [Rhodobacter sp. JA431]